MDKWDAFVVTLLLLVAATAISRKYLTGGQQAALGVIAAAAHLA